MKRASARTLRKLSDLLEQIRQKPGLKEKNLGIFYKKSKSSLHVHEDPAGIFADVTVGKSFVRHLVNSAKDHEELLAAVDRHLAE
jgi:hypothetical protein